MDYYVSKLLRGIVGGSLFSGTLSAICAAYTAFNSLSSGLLGLGTKDFWWFAMLLGGFFGLIVGGILGGIISELNLSLIKAGLCGFLTTAIPGIFLLMLNYMLYYDYYMLNPDSPTYDLDDLTRFGAFFIAITTLTAIFVSYTQNVFFKSE